uniref:R3H-associated N-terminal domain-containing protein n=1 Tax=Plectus sambesii TaxID=2011161 RepID=A0A914X157_9BILA
MGVLRAKTTPALVRITDEITYADYVFDDSGDDSSHDESAVTQSAPTTPARRRPRTKSGGWRKMVGLIDDQPMRLTKVVSGRKLRRMENARLLSALVDPDDVCEDLSDTLPAAITAFTKLFIEQDKMKAWNEFVEKDEEEQREFLENGGKNAASTSGGRLLGGRGAGSTPKRTRRQTDNRSDHPAYSGEACFRRMDGRFRSLLSSRHLPW